MIQQIEGELKKARRAIENALNMATKLARTSNLSEPEKRHYKKVRRNIGHMLDAVNSVRHVQPPYDINDPDLNPEIRRPPREKKEAPPIRIVEFEDIDNA